MDSSVNASWLASVLLMAGRLMIVALFWWDVVFLLIPDFAGTVSYISQRGLPFPEAVAVATIVALLVLPAMLFFRTTEALGFIGLALFCILAAVLFHQYWKLEGFERTMEQIHFMKNMALAGAMLMVTGHGFRQARSQDA